MKLKALEILYSELDELNTKFRKLPMGHWDEKPIIERRKIITEAIEELEQYEQKFKDKEFNYRTKCQNIVSAARLEADDMPDRLAELEKVILDYYLGMGYLRGDFTLQIFIDSQFKFKTITITFRDVHGGSIEKTTFKTTKEMFDRTIERFTPGTKLFEENKYQKGGFINTENTLQVIKELENQNTFYKSIGYESDGTE